MVVAVKSLHNFSNSKPNDPHVCKEELKIEFDVVLAIVEKIPNGTGVMEQLLKNGDSTIKLSRLLCDDAS